MKYLKSKKLYIQVYDELKDYIVKNNLKPGDKLPTEMELTEAFGVSRNVLREAIKTLEIIGVLTSRPGVGMIVNSFDSSFLSNCLFLNLVDDGVNIVMQEQEVRKVLEMGFAQQSFDSCTDERIAQLGKIIQQMKNTPESGDFYVLDAKFHHILLENIKNSILMAFIDSAWVCNRYYRSEFDHEDAQLRYDKHMKIVKALEHRNFEEYLEALDFHFSYNYKKLKKEEE